MSLMGHRFVHSFHLARRLSTNARGEHLYADPTPHPCRYQGSTKRFELPDGTEVTASGVLFTHVEVKPVDTVYPPGADTDDLDAGRSPLSITPRYRLRGGLDHWEVYV